MSREAIFHDAASWIDPTNARNTFISYYNYGAAIGLALDLTLRGRFPGRNLDDFMRAMWTSFGKPEKPYDLQDLQATLARLTGDEAFAREFFERYILDSQMPPFTQLLSEAGFKLEAGEPQEAWIGNFNLQRRGESLVLTSGTMRGQPLYLAGLDRGDEILRIDSRTVSEPEDVEDVLSDSSPGDSLPLRFRRRGQEIETTVQVAANPTLRLVRLENQTPISAQQTEFRSAWLAARSEFRIQTGKYCPRCERKWPHEYETCPFDGVELGLVRSRPK